MFVILSYRQEWSEYWRNELEGRNDADFQIKTCSSKEEVIEYFTTRLWEDPKAPYYNVVCENFEDLIKAERSFDNSTGDRLSESIRFPDYYECEYNGENPDRKLLVEDIRAEVTKKLVKLAVDKEKLKELKELKEKQERDAKDLEFQKKQYESLKKKFEVT